MEMLKCTKMSNRGTSDNGTMPLGMLNHLIKSVDGMAEKKIKIKDIFT